MKKILLSDYYDFIAHNFYQGKETELKQKLENESIAIAEFINQSLFNTYVLKDTHKIKIDLNNTDTPYRHNGNIILEQTLRRLLDKYNSAIPDDIEELIGTILDILQEQKSNDCYKQIKELLIELYECLRRVKNSKGENVFNENNEIMDIIKKYILRTGFILYGLYDYKEDKVTLFLRNITRDRNNYMNGTLILATTPDKDYLNALFMSVFAHELFHRFQYFVMDSIGHGHITLSGGDEQECVFESLARKFELMYNKKVYKNKKVENEMTPVIGLSNPLVDHYCGAAYLVKLNKRLLESVQARNNNSQISPALLKSNFIFYTIFIIGSYTEKMSNASGLIIKLYEEYQKHHKIKIDLISREIIETAEHVLNEKSESIICW